LTQSTTSEATQMTTSSCYIGQKTDKIIAPKKYFSSEQKEALELKMVIRLQCFFRRIMAERRLQLLKDKKQEKIRLEKRVRMKNF
jgi:hypothetical protein